MDQLIITILAYITDHPKIGAALVLFLVVNTAVKAFVDSLVSSRAQWDKTPQTDDTWYEKALTWSSRILVILGKMTAYMAGFRPKSKAEIKTGV